MERKLGSGAFATVWLAYDEGLDAQVAVKVLAENWIGNADVRRRFTEEARILWRLDSDRIVRVHAVDETADGQPYFVMEYADRGSLADRIKAREAVGQHFTVEEVTETALGVAEGLRVAHGLRIVHRDLKPSNVLFRNVPVHHRQSRVERMLLADFGIARSLERAGGTTISAGTPLYMAPEQFVGRADERSDIYAAAAGLYELLTGTVPFPYELDRLIPAQLNEAPTPIEEFRSDVPAALEDLVAKGLAPDPEDRVASADEWASGLTRVLSDMRDGYSADPGLLPTEPRLAPASPPERPDTPEELSPDPAVKRWGRRRPSRAAGIALVVLVVVGITAAFYWRSRHHSDSSPRRSTSAPAGSAASASVQAADQVAACERTHQLSKAQDLQDLTSTITTSLTELQLQAFKSCRWPPGPGDDPDGYSEIRVNTRQGPGQDEASGTDLADYIDSSASCRSLRLGYDFGSMGDFRHLPPFQVTTGAVREQETGQPWTGEAPNPYPVGNETVILHNGKNQVVSAQCASAS
ncbi:MAG: serine/threonine protein kinase [Acidimicrobiia bacterium]|nr:serine/threonine protein kinase [Acidimicrobiia bacterium]